MSGNRTNRFENSVVHANAVAVDVDVSVDVDVDVDTRAKILGISDVIFLDDGRVRIALDGCGTGRSGSTEGDAASPDPS